MQVTLNLELDKIKAAGMHPKTAHNTTNYKSNNNNSLPVQQALSGWHLYEYLKRSFTEANPRCTSTEYDQACYRFARLAGV